MAALDFLAPGLDIVRIAGQSRLPAERVARTYFALGNRFAFDWLRDTARSERLLLLDLETAVAGKDGERLKHFASPDGSHISPAGYAALREYAAPILEAHLREP